MSDALKISKSLLDESLDVSEKAICTMLQVEKISDEACQGEEDERSAKQKRHNIWLSHLPDRFTLHDKFEDFPAVWNATLGAVIQCTNTVGSSGTYLLDLEDLDKAYKPMPARFNDSVFKSLPKRIQYMMEPSDGSILGETALNASIFSGVDPGNFETKRQEVESVLQEDLGEDNSKYRETTVQHILLHHFTGGKNSALEEVSRSTWDIDESLKLHKTAQDNIQQKTVSK